MRLFDDIQLSLTHFTRLPVPALANSDGERLSRASRAAPLAGMVSGAAAALAYVAGFGLTGGSAHVGAAAAVVTHLVVSGAREEDHLVHLSGGTNGTHPATTGLATLLAVLLLRLFLIAEIAFPFQVAMALLASGALARAAQVGALSLIDGQKIAFSGFGELAEKSTLQPTQTEAVFGLSIAAGSTLVAMLFAGGLGGFAAAIGAVFGAACGAAIAFFATLRTKGSSADDVGGSVAIAAELGALMGMVVLMPTPGIDGL